MRKNIVSLFLSVVILFSVLFSGGCSCNALQKLTRGDLAFMLANYHGIPAPKAPQCAEGFLAEDVDVNKDGCSVFVAISQGWMSSTSRNFYPEKIVTARELAEILIRSFALKERIIVAQEDEDIPLFSKVADSKDKDWMRVLYGAHILGEGSVVDPAEEMMLDEGEFWVKSAAQMSLRDAAMFGLKNRKDNLGRSIGPDWITVANWLAQFGNQGGAAGYEVALTYGQANWLMEIVAEKKITTPKGKTNESRMNFYEATQFIGELRTVTIRNIKNPNAPVKVMTRLKLALLLVENYGSQIPSSCKSIYPDVSKEHQCKVEVAIKREWMRVPPRNDGKFGSELSVNWAEFAKIISGPFDLKNRMIMSNRFRNKATDTQHWYEEFFDHLINRDGLGIFKVNPTDVVPFDVGEQMIKKLAIPENFYVALRLFEKKLRAFWSYGLIIDHLLLRWMSEVGVQSVLYFWQKPITPSDLQGFCHNAYVEGLKLPQNVTEKFEPNVVINFRTLEEVVKTLEPYKIKEPTFTP